MTAQCTVCEKILSDSLLYLVHTNTIKKKSIFWCISMDVHFFLNNTNQREWKKI